MNLSGSRYTRSLILILLLQAFAYYVIAARPELTPDIPQLSTFPTSINGWNMISDQPLQQEVLDVLKADDTLNRIYKGPGPLSEVSLYMAFFKTQRYGQAPHSPKNCLPGAGYEPTESGFLPISVPGKQAPIVANRYVVARGDEKSVVIYWYQSHNRVIASEYAAKFWLVADAIRYRRSDTALIRVVVPVFQNNDAAATRCAVSFIQAIFPTILRQLPL
jgi:EpsI family protein